METGTVCHYKYPNSKYFNFNWSHLINFDLIEKFTINCDKLINVIKKKLYM